MEDCSKNNTYDIILIGDNLSMYMASIYLQTSNYNQVVLTKSCEEDLLFEGHDKVVGVKNVKNQEDLLQRVREQTKYLKVPVKTENILSIDFDDCDIIKENKFKVVTDNSVYYSKCLVYNNSEIETEGLFSTNMNIKFNEAIEILGDGCKLSFKIRDFISRSEFESSCARQNLIKIK